MARKTNRLFTIGYEQTPAKEDRDGVKVENLLAPQV